MLLFFDDYLEYDPFSLLTFFAYPLKVGLFPLLLLFTFQADRFWLYEVTSSFSFRGLILFCRQYPSLFFALYL